MRPPWGATMLTIDAGLRNTKLWDSISYDLRINALSSRSRQDAEGNPIPTPEPVPCYEGGG
ncbi:MAG: hypothetical protein GWO22_06710, partial [Actinobacteria bacterium]|nr:hypothetical protein [Actinomycetota bacterium]